MVKGDKPRLEKSHVFRAVFYSQAKGMVLRPEGDDERVIHVLKYTIGCLFGALGFVSMEEGQVLSFLRRRIFWLEYICMNQGRTRGAGGCVRG